MSRDVLADAIAAYMADSPEPPDTDTYAVIKRLEEADDEVVTAFAAIHAEFDHHKAAGGRKRPVGIMEVYLIGVLVRAVRIERNAEDYEDAEKGAQETIKEAREGLELLKPFLELLIQETYNREQPDGLDYDLVPHWPEGKTAAEKAADRREARAMLREQAIALGVELPARDDDDLDPVTHESGDVATLVELEAAYKALSMAVWTRGDWGQQRLENLRLTQKRKNEEPAKLKKGGKRAAPLKFQTRAALRDLVASLFAAAPKARQEDIATLAGAVFGVGDAIGLEQVKDAREQLLRDAGKAQLRNAKLLEIARDLDMRKPPLDSQLKGRE